MAECDDARHGRELVGSPLWQRLYHSGTKYTAHICARLVRLSDTTSKETYNWKGGSLTPLSRNS